MKLKCGDRIEMEYYIMGKPTGEWHKYTVEEFRQCLGIFESDDHRTAGNFTPLCELYKAGPDSREKYISNYGSYTTNMVPGWRLVNKGPVKELPWNGPGEK